MLDSAPSPLMGEGWGEGDPPFVLSLSKHPLVIARSVSDVAIPPQITPRILPILFIHVGFGPLSLDERGLG